ncbi:unnamed protein product [Gulo gulo]|uniref:Uncharacterized protein n=1 Tax=Gulo gulo TaxID=48420 RepID=A0A9X9PX45_GULGU|nr:unnamed protein product [Gulo gulo]
MDILAVVTALLSTLPGFSSYQVSLLGVLLRTEAALSPRLRGFCLLFLCQQGRVLSPRKEERET